MGKQYFGSELLDEHQQIPHGSLFGISFTIDNPKEVKELEKIDKEFEKFYKQLYLDLVLEIHKYLIRITPMHTGRLRGGWTAALEKYRRDYSRQLKDTSLYDAIKKTNKTPEYREYAFDSSEVDKGKTESILEDHMPSDTDMTLTNAVPYKDDIDSGTTTVPGRHFTDKIQYKGEMVFDQYFAKWLEKMEKAQKVVAPDKVREIDV